ncbi:MAG: NUDIX hydrolase, partial [Oscillospiraceae bacterium]|nr:NUDIX hydrolase [Oscillospiraceae bacterium]
LKADRMVFINRSVSERSHSIFYSYLAVVSCDKDSVVLQEGETTDYTWVDIKDFREYTESEQAMRNHVERYRPYLDEIFSDM